MPPSLEELILDLKIQVLEEKRAELCKNLTAFEHFPYLRSKYILTLEDEEVIKQELTSKQKNSKFLDILIKRGPKAFDELVKSILEIKTQVFLAEMLNKTYEEKRRMLQVINKDSKKLATSDEACSKLEPFSQTTHPVPNPAKHNMASIQLNVDTLSLPTPEKKQNIVCHNSEGIEHSELVGRKTQKQDSYA
ncbi:hypothetical protein CHS0354_026686 [Potamilus streckersoni]|uniref:CARD domain-containing protein n=1 Tax=Potamilus streckersoni TaxID=2493646 RepID=A0AAE0S7U1_9BIVA|nr:hypothetical protein CHS0354_026686 [Potamilus streckersoni]